MGHRQQNDRGRRTIVVFTATLREASIERKKWDLIFVWGGQIAGILKHRKAADLIKSLIEETNIFYTEISMRYAQ